MTTEKLAIEGGAPLRTAPFGNRHALGEPELAQLMQIVDDAQGQWHSGYKVREFEDGFARRHGVRYAVAADSGHRAPYTPPWRPSTRSPGTRSSPRR